jgi:hypothetical protein
VSQKILHFPECSRPLGTLIHPTPDPSNRLHDRRNQLKVSMSLRRPFENFNEIQLVVRESFQDGCEV